MTGSWRLPAAAVVATCLSAICLSGVFLEGTWVFPSFGAVVVTIGAAEAARRAAAPRTMVPVVGAAALLFYLVARFAHDQALFYVLPSQAAIDRLQTLSQAGHHDITRFAAPIAVSTGIELLAVGGVGIVALLVDTLAVTWRRASLAGLPLLALYTVPTSVAPTGVNWLPFTLAGIGYLTLLLAESRERLNRWGRPMRQLTERSAGWRPGVETSPLVQVGRRVGAAALGLALVVPAAIPEVTPSTFAGWGSGLGFGGGGGNRVEVLNPIVDLGRDLRNGSDQPVIRYTGSATYLRLVGLDLFDGNTWHPSTLKVDNKANNVENKIPRPPGLGFAVTTRTRHYKIDVLDLQETWLPLPYPTRQVSHIDGTWVYDQSTFNVFPVNGSTRQLSYDVDSLDVEPTADQLRAAGTPDGDVDRYLTVPPDLPPIVRSDAEQVTRGQTTAYDKAVALQNWFRTRFAYSTDVTNPQGDANGAQAISIFLHSRVGYCVHFASAMAVMARELNIPSRVAVGFAAGAAEPDGTHVVRLTDAHAWPELYFQGAGWVAFEPTPGGPAGAPPIWTRGTGIGGGQPSSGPSTPTPSSSSTASSSSPLGKVGALGTNAPRTSTRKAAAVKRVALLPFVAVAALLLLLLLPMLLYRLLRAARWRRARTPGERVTASWAELLDTLRDFRVPWRPSDSPRRGVARIVARQKLSAEAGAALSRLAAATERARYAPELGEVSDVRADLAVVRDALRRRASWPVRVRARLWPTAVGSLAGTASAGLADGLDGLDAASAAIGRRLIPRRRTASG
ncbi:MAG: hypothetical protein QOE01_1576 [Actinomycetota bacterium]|nr:hypothetical protein [Actinomycetota bacterium]